MLHNHYFFEALQHIRRKPDRLWCAAAHPLKNSSITLNYKFKMCVSYLRDSRYLDLVSPQLAVSTERSYQVSAMTRKQTRETF
jgi:hypothetical protein